MVDLGENIHIFLRTVTYENMGNYDDIIFMTHAVHNRITEDYAPTQSEVKSSPVVWKIVYPNMTQEEN